MLKEYVMASDPICPKVKIRVEEPTDTNTQRHLPFNIVFENQGNGPAHITLCEIRGGFDGKEREYDPLNPIHSPVGTSIATSEQTRIPLTVVGDEFPNPQRQFKLHVWFQYRGEASKLYSANFYINRTNGSWEGGEQHDTEY
jgi:hypothetical protein